MNSSGEYLAYDEAEYLIGERAWAASMACSRRFDAWAMSKEYSPYTASGQRPRPCSMNRAATPMLSSGSWRTPNAAASEPRPRTTMRSICRNGAR